MLFEGLEIDLESVENNLHRLAIAMTLYAQESSDYLPYPSWGALPDPGAPDCWAYATRNNGRLPGGPDSIPDVTGRADDSAQAVVQRQFRRVGQLWPFVRDDEVFHCPADQGDALNTQVKTCWDGWGNSYLVQWSGDSFRIKKVTADLLAPRNAPNGIPTKMSEVALKPANKILQGDWPWHANRDVNVKQTLWHNYKGRRYENMLFGDGHVDYVQFPKQMDNWIGDPPNPSNKWW